MSDTLMDFDEAVRRYDPVLGLEVHVELGTATKMFDAAPNVFGAQPNTMVTPTSVGLPGALPVVNARGVEYAIRIGLALGCEIAQSCRFARKNYFYPDLAKDFQTSQSDEPIAYDGALEIEMEDGSFFTIPIERAHMEEDAGKNTHIGGADGRIEGASHSLVDYNRAGVPLVEIVTRPIEGTGARAPQVAAAYVRTLRDIFRALGVSEARMERGNVRADVNVSLRESPDAPLGTRTETKNVNTFRGIEQVVRYEIQRQAAILAAGGEVLQETRHGQAARKWWMGELSRTAKEQETALEDMAVTPKQIAELQGLVDSGRLTDKLARQVLEGVLAGEGDPEAVAAARGLEVVSDDSALLVAVDEALAANPDVADKIRGGKVQAAGAIVGAVMKATRGQADAKRVRELVMERVQG